MLHFASRYTPTSDDTEAHTLGKH